MSSRCPSTPARKKSLVRPIWYMSVGMRNSCSSSLHTASESGSAVADAHDQAFVRALSNGMLHSVTLSRHLRVVVEPLRMSDDESPSAVRPVRVKSSGE